MSDVTAAAGFAPAAKGTAMPTFTASVTAVQHRLGCSQNKARRATREYLRHARRPSLPGLLDHAALVVGRAPVYGDPTGETAVRRVMGGGAR